MYTIHYNSNVLMERCNAHIMKECKR